MMEELKKKILSTRPGNRLRILKNDLVWIFNVLFHKTNYENLNNNARDIDIREMNFVSYAQLSQDVRKWCIKIPRDFDAILGIPRSGIIPAAMLALFMNKEMGEPYRFKEAHGLFGGGLRLKKQNFSAWARKDVKKVLVVDDSYRSGRTIREVKDLLCNIDGVKIEYAAVYPVSDQKNELDFYYRIVPLPRMFEWNVMHHDILKDSCCDLDGVLCIDPTGEENDDGPKYWQFIRSTPPFFLPTIKIHTIVTCRLEKYREETTSWLEKNGVKYDNLIMMNYKTKKDRVREGKHGEFKAKVYLNSNCRLFIESNAEQSKFIFDFTRKPVLCVDEMKMYAKAKFLRPLFSL